MPETWSVTKQKFAAATNIVWFSRGSRTTLNIHFARRSEVRKRRIRPYCVESTASHPNSEVKLRQAVLVLGWATTRESTVPYPFCVSPPLQNEARGLYVQCWISPCHNCRWRRVHHRSCCSTPTAPRPPGRRPPPGTGGHQGRSPGGVRTRIERKNERTRQRRRRRTLNWVSFHMSSSWLPANRATALSASPALGRFTVTSSVESHRTSRKPAPRKQTNKQTNNQHHRETV